MQVKSTKLGLLETERISMLWVLKVLKSSLGETLIRVTGEC